MSSPKRGEVYLVNLDPTFGTEIKKTRPSVVVQNDVSNQHSTITSIAPITSTKKVVSPVHVEVKAPEGGLDTDSVVLVNQIRAVDQRRLLRRLGTLKPRTMQQIDRAISVNYGLILL